jgi:hypothetical protein
MPPAARRLPADRRSRVSGLSRRFSRLAAAALECYSDNDGLTAKNLGGLVAAGCCRRCHRHHCVQGSRSMPASRSLSHVTLRHVSSCRRAARLTEVFLTNSGKERPRQRGRDALLVHALGGRRLLLARGRTLATCRSCLPKKPCGFVLNKCPERNRFLSYSASSHLTSTILSSSSPQPPSCPCGDRERKIVINHHLSQPPPYP